MLERIGTSEDADAFRAIVPAEFELLSA